MYDFEAKPLEGVMCFAEIYSVDNFVLPKGYTFIENGGPSKFLMYNAAGIYSSKAIDQFEDAKVEYFLTGSDGKIKFPHI